jgi:hypothetical protein
MRVITNVPATPKKVLVSGEEVAKALGVQPDVINNLRLKKLIPAVKITKRVVRYNLDLVIKTIMERQLDE